MNVVNREQFDLIKGRHGGYASWAVWIPQSPTDGPKSGVGDLSIFDLSANPTTLSLLKPDVMMVALNISGPLFPEPFRNFHSPSPSANDFKIRFAFDGTPYYGAYMTDIIKDVPRKRSTDLLAHLRTRPALIDSNIERLREEIRDLGSLRPTILAFGKDAHGLLHRNLREDEYEGLIVLRHYSDWISKEDYRETVIAQLRQAPP